MREKYTESPNLTFTMYIHQATRTGGEISHMECDINLVRDAGYRKADEKRHRENTNDKQVKQQNNGDWVIAVESEVRWSGYRLDQ